MLALLNTGKCNQVNNNCGCSWDGGDCCGVAQNPTQYSACVVQSDGTCCVDPDFVAATVGPTRSTTETTVTTRQQVTRTTPTTSGFTDTTTTSQATTSSAGTTPRAYTCRAACSNEATVGNGAFVIIGALFRARLADETLLVCGSRRLTNDWMTVRACVCACVPDPRSQTFAMTGTTTAVALGMVATVAALSSAKDSTRCARPSRTAPAVATQISS